MAKEKDITGIKLTVYFHTNNMELGPKVAYSKGSVYMPTNHKHGIRASDVNDQFFFSKTQGTIMEAITRCLEAYNVKIVKDDKASQYKKLKQMEKSGEFFEGKIA